MNKNNAFIIILALILLGGGVYVAQKGYFNQTGIPSTIKGQAQNSSGSAVERKTYDIIYTDAGFSPSAITVKAGDTVNFVNNSSGTFWPASAVHPTHSAYPGSSISKCATSTESGIFDACKPLSVGSSWTFQFNQKGSWNYHDHLHPAQKGTVVVE